MPQSPEPARRYASQTAAAKYFGCSVRTLRRHIAAGDITAYRLPGGRLILVDLNEVDAALRPIPTAKTG